MDDLNERPARIEIKGEGGRPKLNLGEIFEYRELLYFLVWRDIKVRYKQTALGAAWAILQPFLTMLVFSLFFGQLAGIPSQGVPYPVFSYSGLVIWTFFANGLLQASSSLVASSNMITKVYFPRLIIPFSTVLSGVVDFILAFIVLLLLMLFYNILPTKNIIFLPLFLILAFITSLGTGFWFSALNVQYRDVRYVVPFLIQIWLFATPIAYPSNLVPEQWRWLYSLNPMVAVVEGFRWALLDTEIHLNVMVLVSSVAALLVFISGAYFFRRMEDTFADRV